MAVFDFEKTLLIGAYGKNVLMVYFRDDRSKVRWTKVSCFSGSDILLGKMLDFSWKRLLMWPPRLKDRWTFEYTADLTDISLLYALRRVGLYRDPVVVSNIKVCFVNMWLWEMWNRNVERVEEPSV